MNYLKFSRLPIRLLKKLFPRYKIVIDFYQDNNYCYLVFRRNSEFVKEIKILLALNIVNLFGVIYGAYWVMFSEENPLNVWKLTPNILGLILAGLVIYKLRRKHYWEGIAEFNSEFEALQYLNFPF